MVKITLDHSAMIMNHRHPIIRELQKLEEEGKVRLYHADNLGRELASLSEGETRIYDRLREMVYGRPQGELNLAEHGDLVLLVNHMKSGRDYFLTLQAGKYDSLAGHRNLKVRTPDKKFLKEIHERVNIPEQTKKKKTRKK